MVKQLARLLRGRNKKILVSIHFNVKQEPQLIVWYLYEEIAKFQELTHKGYEIIEEQMAKPL